jgi:Zn-dependent metalloprotease
MNEEKLSFVVSLSGTFWERHPQFSIWLDDHAVIQSEIASSAEQLIRFERSVDEGAHELKIRLENKTNTDTIIENGEVVNDMLLNIDDIVIDDISLGQLLWSAEYILDKKQTYKGQEITHLDGCVNLGWNGTYTLKFNSPFYIWLLEKL